MEGWIMESKERKEVGAKKEKKDGGMEKGKKGREGGGR